MCTKNIKNLSDFQKAVYNELEMSNGSDNLYRHNMFKNSLYTDGIKSLIDSCKCYWLVSDAIVFCEMVLNKEDFVTITLIKNKENSSAIITYDDGNNNILHTEEIPFTDFPLPEIKLFYENKTLYLPNER